MKNRSLESGSRTNRLATNRRATSRHAASHSVARASFDDHHLYQGAVQNVDADLDFAARCWRNEHGTPLVSIREDFCGTALLSCQWAARRGERRAIGIDLDRATLDWARRVNLPVIGKAAERVSLIEGDVLHVDCEAVQAVLALNFSYWVFKTRERMRSYFEAARRGLAPGGMLVLDAFGGGDSMGEGRDRRSIAAQRLPCGTRLPRYTYVWDQSHFNPVTHEYRCAIHFDMADGSSRKNAFRYDWRFWTLPELRELLAEAGFARTEIFVDGWDDELDEGDGIFRRRTAFAHDPVWVAYVVAYTSA